MKNTFKKIISMACVTVLTTGLATVDASALTRRLYGDINNDGIINQTDVDILQQYMVKLIEFDKYQLIAADVDGDGRVSLNDVITLKRLVDGYIDELPVGTSFLY
ncbi:MAG: hypothetical protein HFI34_11880 [Lachnospiraceae bacterium]|nr:hypothetical protein [Lachnospiraceae bacterium]